MSNNDQRTALLGWGVGAIVAVAAYVGALQFSEQVPTMPLVASFPSSSVDPIVTGSIDTQRSQPMPGQTPLTVQGKLDAMFVEMAQMREALAAAQAASMSAHRRLEAIEQSMSLVTASVERAPGQAESQPLPAAIEPLSAVVPDARIVLPSPIQTEGGAIAITMRPLEIVPDSDQDSVDATAMALSQTPFAIDIGGAASLEAIDALWMAQQDAYEQALSGLSPRILLQQTSQGALDLRLVAGPIPDAADAAMLCAQLVAAGMERCLPAIFDGQQLALR